MPIQRMDHVGVVVEDLVAATAFFVGLGLELVAEWVAEGDEVGRIIGLEGVRAEVAMLRTADGHGRLELTRFLSPQAGGDPAGVPANERGIRHLSFAVDDLERAITQVHAQGSELVGEVLEYGDTYKLCYVRGPEGIIVELAEAVR